MGLLDEDGNLLGVLNVVDLLVVVLLVGAVVGVAALVTVGSGTDTETVTRHIDVAFPDESEVVTAGLAEGTVTIQRDDGRITDVAHGTAGGQLGTVARVRVTFSRPEPADIGPDEAVLNQRVVVTGTRVRLSTGDVDALGRVRAVGQFDPAFERVPATVVVEADVPPAVASSISPGDRHRVGNATLAAVEAVDRDGSATSVTLTLSARTRNGGLYYGTERLRPGTDIRFATTDYEFRGTVTEVRR
jgi:hypothetical protein